jgi:hypothetical protein
MLEVELCSLGCVIVSLGCGQVEVVVAVVVVVVPNVVVVAVVVVVVEQIHQHLGLVEFVHDLVDWLGCVIVSLGCGQVEVV